MAGGCIRIEVDFCFHVITIHTSLYYLSSSPDLSKSSFILARSSFGDPLGALAASIIVEAPKASSNNRSRDQVPAIHQTTGTLTLLQGQLNQIQEGSRQRLVFNRRGG